MSKPAKPCSRCGGIKDEKRQGARYCSSCRIDPTFIELQKERDMLAERQKATKYRRQKGIQPRVKKINDDGLVWCKSCNDYLSPNKFKKRGDRDSQYESLCKICHKQYHHENRLKKVFGIDSAEYHRMLEIQDYRCAICRNKPQSRRLAVDHCHKTGVIRGLLCTHCNHKLLGAAHDSVELLERAICYLESPPAQSGVPVPIHEEYSHKKPRNTP